MLDLKEEIAEQFKKNTQELQKCNCYHDEFYAPQCYGTMEREECSCGGNEKKCDFYEYKRKGGAE